MYDGPTRDKTYRRLPAAHTALIVGLGTGTGEEGPPLGDVFLAFLSTDLNLLLFATAPQLILLQAALALVL